jgi:hypothetical protein
MRFDAALLKLATASAAPPVVPRSNLLLHYDAATIVAADGDAVSAWSNQAAAYHAAQADGAHQGTYVARSAMNGMPAVRMSGADYMEIVGLSRAASQGYTLYCVADITSTSAMTGNTIIQGGQTAFYASVGVAKYPQVYLGEGVGLGYTPDTRLGPVCLTESTGLTPRAWTDRILTGQGSVGAQAGLVAPVYIGGPGGNGPRADVGCILLYEGIHDDHTRTRVWDCIYRRWRVAAPLRKTNDGPRAWPVAILSGQSNANGNAPLTDISAPYTLPEPGVRVFNATPQNYIAREWEDLRPVPSPDNYGYGVELSMMRDLAAHPSWANPALFKCAQGSTGLYDFWSPAGPGAGWRMLVDMWDRMVATAPNVGDTLDPRFFLWIQGETDSILEAHALAYEANLTAFIAAVRALFGKPQLPFWIVALTVPNGFGAYAHHVRAAQEAVAAADPHVHILAPLAPLPDGVHGTGGAYIDKGHDIAASVIAKGC